MLLRSKLFHCLRLPIHPMLGGSDQNAMLGVNAASQQFFYCLQLPIHPMQGGGDQNAMLGVMKVSEANAASQQTLFIVSSYPSNSKGW